MTGSEKQIKWAKDIIKNIESNFDLEFVIDSIDKRAKSSSDENGNITESRIEIAELAKKCAGEYLKKLNSIESAHDIIEDRDSFYYKLEDCGSEHYEKWEYSSAHKFFESIAKRILGKRRGCANHFFCQTLGYIN